MGTEIMGLVLRAQDKKRTAEFYRALGLTADEHAHGGPTHFEIGPNDSAIVVELYQASENYPKDTLMLGVESLEKALEVCGTFSIFPVLGIKNVGSMRFVYVLDPDERPLMLIEQ